MSPTNRIEAARSKYPLATIGRIATNTPAFEEYGLNLMLVEADSIREKWHLDISKPFTVDNVFFQLRATAHGFDGSLETRDGRYYWGFTRNTFHQFQDHTYWPRSFRYHDEESARLAKTKSEITAQDAEEITRTSLHQIGLTEKQLHFIEPPSVNQYKFEEIDGTVYPLPMFNVSWDIEGWEDENGIKPIRIEVSGITKQIAEYLNYCPGRPTVPIATNYFSVNSESCGRF